MATGTLVRKKARAEANGHAVSLTFDDVAVCIPQAAFQFEGFRAWTLSDDFPEEGRIAFIDGEVFVDMSKEEITTHAILKTEIGRALAQICIDQPIGMVLIDGARVANKAANVSNVPDIVFVSFDSVESGRVTLTPAKQDSDRRVEVVGSPDVVVEIVSDSSVGKDTQRLRSAYHAADIPEYWLIDARGDRIVFQILLHRRTGYTASPERDGWVRSRTFDREFRLVREANRIGLWTYRLESRRR
jgi:Uma2 family endonuclease